MPKALYTPAVRAEIMTVELFVAATRLPSDPGNDRFQLGECRVSCRYRAAGGDAVSRQILGCANDIRTGQVRSGGKDAVIAQLFKAKTEMGIIGPDIAVEELATNLAIMLGGVIVSPTDAEILG